MNSKKREDYIDWKEYFMGIAFLAAQRSKDPDLQVGACIVDKKNIIVGIGYNGMPMGCHDNDFPWSKNNPSKLDNKHLYVCHAEMNAIINKNSANVKGCTIYVSLFPCNECAKIIIQSGIKNVIYLSDEKSHKPKYIASKRMFDAAKVNYSQYKPKRDKIEITFVGKNTSRRFSPSIQRTVQPFQVSNTRGRRGKRSSRQNSTEEPKEQLKALNHRGRLRGIKK